MSEEILMSSVRRVSCPIRQQCTWDGKTDQEIIDTPVIAGPAVLKFTARLDALEAGHSALRSALAKAKGE